MFLYSKLKTICKFKDNRLLFLLAIDIVPVAFVFLTSLITGSKIRTMWMTPFYLFFGVFVIYIYQLQINLNMPACKKLKKHSKIVKTTKVADRKFSMSVRKWNSRIGKYEPSTDENVFKNSFLQLVE